MMVIALREVRQEGRAAICGEDKWIVVFWEGGDMKETDHLNRLSLGRKILESVIKKYTGGLGVV
jgi:hypothetical protein